MYLPPYSPDLKLIEEAFAKNRSLIHKAAACAREGSDEKYRFEFPESDETIATNQLSDIDDKLLTVFMKRVEELG